MGDEISDKNKNSNDPSKPGMIDSLIDLGTAATKMTIDQVQNALTALTDPRAAIEHVKDTMHNLSDAMNPVSVAAEPAPVENDLRGAATGREHLSSESMIEENEYSLAEENWKDISSSKTVLPPLSRPTAQQKSKASVRAVNRRKS